MGSLRFVKQVRSNFFWKQFECKLAYEFVYESYNRVRTYVSYDKCDFVGEMMDMRFQDIFIFILYNCVL